MQNWLIWSNDWGQAKSLLVCADSESCSFVTATTTKNQEGEVACS